MSDRVEWVFEGGLDDGITSATVVFETVSNSSHRSRQRKMRERHHHQLTENEAYSNSYYGVHGSEFPGRDQGHDSPLSIPHSASRKPSGSNASVSASSRSSRSRRRKQHFSGGSGDPTTNSPSTGSWIHGKTHQKRRSRTDRLQNEVNIAAVSGVYSSGACLPAYQSGSSSHGQRARGEQHHLHEVVFTDDIDYEVDMDDAIVQLCLGSMACGSNRGGGGSGTQTAYFEVECEEDASYVEYGHASYSHGCGQTYEMISNTRGGRGNAFMRGRGRSYRGGPGKTRALAIKSPFASGKSSSRCTAVAPYTKVCSAALATSHYGSTAAAAAAMWAGVGPAATSRNKKLKKKKGLSAVAPASAADTVAATYQVPPAWGSMGELAAPSPLPPPSLPPVAHMRLQAECFQDASGPHALRRPTSATLHPIRTPPLGKACLSPLPSPSFMPPMNLLPPSQLSMCSNGATGELNEYFRL